MLLSYLTLHLGGELAHEFVPVLLLTRHLVQQLVEHPAQLLRHRVELQPAHFPFQGRFVGFLRAQRENWEVISKKAEAGRCPETVASHTSALICMFGRGSCLEQEAPDR